MPQQPDDPPPSPDIDVAVSLVDERWLAFLGLAGSGADGEAAAAGLLQPLAAAALGAGGWQGGPAELGIVLADDGTVHALNRDYRGVDKPTNVLSFALQEEAGSPSGAGPAMLGDVLLAFETVAREAAEREAGHRDYTCHLVAHGVLHLIGYDHKEEAEAEFMERLEARVLAGFGIGDPYEDAPAEASGGPAEGVSGPSP